MLGRERRTQPLALSLELREEIKGYCKTPYTGFETYKAVKKLKSVEIKDRKIAIYVG